MDSLPNELFQKIMKVYYVKNVLSECMEKVEKCVPHDYSNERKLIVAERGAFVGRVFACKNCEDFGFPCIGCHSCVWNKSLKTLFVSMYTVMKTPASDVTPYRYGYITKLQKNCI